MSTVMAPPIASAISPKDYEIAAQFAHFFSAYALVFTLATFFGTLGLVLSALGMLAWASVKEFVYDIKHENPLVRGSSILDFFMYLAGIGSAIGVALAR